MTKTLFPLAVLAFLLTGCAAKETAAPATPAATGSSKPVIALVVKTLTNPFFINMEKGARRAESELGFTLKVKSGAQETSIDQQIAILEGLIEENVAAIVIAPGSSTELIPVLKKAQDHGIKLVNIDNQIDPAAAKKAGLTNVPFISVDNVQGGYLSAKALIAHVKKPTQVVILEGIREAANANQRKEGALKAFSENPNVQVVGSETAHWKIDEGYAVTKALLLQHPQAELIFAANDMMALGSLQYLKEAGLSHVRVAGYDDLEEAQKALAAGQLVATIDQQADQQGSIGAATAFKMLKGEAVAPVVQVDVRLVTKE